MSVEEEYSRSAEPTKPASVLLRELVAHLREHRTQLREEWARRITEAKVLTAMTKDEVFAEATSVYDNYVEALETGTFEALSGLEPSPKQQQCLSRRVLGYWEWDF